ncbi:MAG: DNA-directed RNA polymerase subunit beta', partial [Candidatus Pacebacteria bacterium]|nr:DNA-directed RNA polymerase subunit beta' [Candidatus Paceibacterota bacterium]
PVQRCGMKGLVASPSGRVIELPIKDCFKEGFDVLEYFISTHGARKGTADTALRTSTSGYLTRRLVDVAHDVIISDDDCGDTVGVLMRRSDSEEVNQDFVHKLFGRVCMENVKDTESGEVIVKNGEYITLKAAQKIKELNIETVKVRSPLSCKCIRGICKKCYGLDLGWKKTIDLGEAVGVIAAQVIGEPGTQLTMRTFHTGGVAGEADITRGLPRVEEVFERRAPKGEAEMATKDGRILEINEKEGRIKMVPIKGGKEADEEDAVEYEVPLNTEILVKKDDMVKKGQVLCAGSLDLKKLFKLMGEEETRNYIIKEIQKVYVSQGVSIHDKHVEIIVKQMFSRSKIKDPGDSFFSEEEIISKARLLEENEKLEKDGKKPIIGETIILGISKVALNTDSFLSAASFQETSRILIESSLRGEEDNLRGLKENVILGKLVPIGTGYDKNKKYK